MFDLVIPIAFIAVLAILTAILAYLGDRRQSEVEKIYDQAFDIVTAHRVACLRAGLDPDVPLKDQLYLNPTDWLGIDPPVWDWPGRDSIY